MKTLNAGPDTLLFRRALGRFTTGVVLITAQTPDGPEGMLVNSFTSVSLDPPLVSFCAARTSTTWPAVRAVGGFTVNILSEAHEELCRQFIAKSSNRFSARDWGASVVGHPLLSGALGAIDCAITDVHDAGDHQIVVARALTWQHAESGRPLIFHSGGYARLAS